MTDRITVDAHALPRPLIPSCDTIQKLSCTDSLMRDFSSKYLESTYDPENCRKDFNIFFERKIQRQMQKQISSDENVWKDIFIKIENLVDSAKKKMNAELEVHIGRIDPNTKRFDPNVSKAWFDSQLSKMDSFQHWDRKSIEWERMEEIIFTGDVRMRREPDGIGSFMKKVFIGRVDIPMSDCKYDVRIVLKTENRCHKNHGKIEFLRFKERKTFQHRNFCYFFTKVWEGRSMEEVYKAKAKYEIELECIDVSGNKSYLAKSMLLKCGDLVGDVITKKKKMMERTKATKEQPDLTKDENFLRGINDLYQKLIVQKVSPENLFTNMTPYPSTMPSNPMMFGNPLTHFYGYQQPLPNLTQVSPGYTQNNQSFGHM